MTAETSANFSGLDGAILSTFFISYSVLALIQVNNLFSGKFLRFFVLLLVTIALTGGIEFAKFDDLCVERASAILCSNGGAAFSALASVWIYVSAGMLFCFCLIVGVQKAQNRKY